MTKVLRKPTEKEAAQGEDFAEALLALAAQHMDKGLRSEMACAALIGAACGIARATTDANQQDLQRLFDECWGTEQN